VVESNQAVVDKLEAAVVELAAANVQRVEIAKVETSRYRTLDLTNEKLVRELARLDVA